MKTENLFFLLTLLCPFSLYAQTIQEICPVDNPNGTVVDFEYHGGIYATGFFTNICSNSANYIAVWDGNEWIPIPIELDDPGHSIKNYDGVLYIAKYEESIDSNWVYYYDGLNLLKLGEGVYLTTATGYSNLSNIYDIIKYDDKIIVCGEFDRVGAQSISGIMQQSFDGWAPLLGGLSGNIQGTAPVMFPHQMLVHDGVLYVAGNFRYADGIEVNGIAKWDGGSWDAMGAGFNGTVYSVTVFNNEIYVGGSFTESNGELLNALAKWNGSQWVSPGFGFTATNPNDFTFVHTMTEIEGELYLGGGLKQVEYDNGSIVPCGGIISYSGTDINTFEGGVSGVDIEAITQDPNGGVLIGGGVFGNGYLGKIGNFTSTQKIESDESVSLHPNPVENTVSFQTKNVIGLCQILDISGRLILTQEAVNNQLNVNSLDSGVYFVEFEIGSNLYIKKFIKI